MTDTAPHRNGGQIIASALIAEGVDTAFCVPGESYLEVLDALYDARDSVRLVTCRHENGAAYMAEAYAKFTGNVGVALVTRGPGACNASIGVHTAFQDSTPMVLFVGHVRREDIGREAFQEVDFERMFG
ncbi:MAG: thiamine pyrophosphate-binding protein, partial [Sphingomonadales bacterium]|nr:thiamine pyrophosphate-binding protein [Sphingomonadales bacterium]